MSDMHEPECHNELEKSPSCQGIDGQKTVYRLIYLSFFHTLSPACLLFSLHHFSSSLQFSQNKVAILYSKWEYVTENKPGADSSLDIRRSQEPSPHQSNYIRVLWELVKFTFNIRIGKLLAALWPWLLTRQSLFVPHDVFRALSQHFVLCYIRTYIQCGIWGPAKTALQKLLIWNNLFRFMSETLRHAFEVSIHSKWQIENLRCK